METLLDLIEDFEKTYDGIDWDDINLDKELEEYNEQRSFYISD